MSNTKIRVSSSQSKHKIYIGNLPRAWTKEKLTDELNKNVKGIDRWTPCIMLFPLIVSRFDILCLDECRAGEHGSGHVKGG